MSARRVLPALLLAFLLGASILAVQPVDAYPVGPSQTSTVRTLYKDPAAPFMNWQPVTTTNTFFLHSDPTGSAGPPPVSYSPGPSVANPFLDVNQPTANVGTPITVYDGQDGGDYGKQAAMGTSPQFGGGPIRFPMDPSLITVDEMRIYSITSTVWAGCTSGQLEDAVDILATGILTRLFRQVPDPANPGTWKDASRLAEFRMQSPGSDSSIPGTVVRYSGSAVLGTVVQANGALVNAGERLVVEYSVPAPGDVSCVMYYDGRYVISGSPNYSQVTLTTDAMRNAIVPVGQDGKHVTGFAPASSMDAAGRRLNIDALQAHALGAGMAHQLIDDKHANVRIYSLDAQDYLYYVDDSANNFPRDYEKQTIKLVSSRTDIPRPEPDVEQHIGNGIIQRRYVFAYPAELPDTKQIEAQFYSYSDNWVTNSPIFAIGGKGISFKLLDNEAATHLVNRGEPTEFGFIVNNTGTTDDVITVVASDPGAGWTARVLGGGKFFVRPGGFAIGTVEVVPAATATTGSRSVTLTASSSFADVANPPSITLTTQLTDTVTRALDIFTETNLFEVSPGQTKGYSVTVRNLGTARDSVVVIPSFPGNVQGWTIRANPSSAQIVAGGFQEIQVIITPPASAASGMTFPLGLTVAEVGNSAVTDRIDVTVEVFAAEGLLAKLFDAGVNRTMRAVGPEPCVDGVSPVCGSAGPAPAPGTPTSDTDFDTTSAFRIDVTNDGDLPARYRVESKWNEIPGTIDFGDCQDILDTLTLGILGPTVDGVPDGWRFNYAQGVRSIHTVGSEPLPNDDNPPRGDYATSSSFSGIYRLNTTENPLVVPAHTTVPIYFELGWLSGDPCPVNDYTPAGEGSVGGFDILSPVAAMDVIVTNLANPAESSTSFIKSDIGPAGDFIGSNRFSGATHLVEVVPSPNQAPTSATTLGSSAAFDMIAVNKGNENDGLRISVTGNPNWIHQVVVGENVPEKVTCDGPTNNGATVFCPKVGVYDEVHFRVLSTPTDRVSVGDRDQITVTVFSGDSPGIFDTQSLTARAAGTLSFTSRILGESTRTVAAGQSVAFPLAITNQGTADDSYRVTVTQGDASWKPVVSSSAPIFIPAGFEVPAYVAVSPPLSLATGASSQFNVQVESVGSGARQAFQLFGVIAAPSALRLEGLDGQDVLLTARESVQNVTVVATKTSGAAGDTVTFTVDRNSLPADWTVDDGESDADRAIVKTLASSGTGVLPSASATFKVTAPADALGNARAILHVDAVTSTALRAATDIGLNLASTQGVLLEMDNSTNSTQVVAPGGPAVFNLTVSNLGLGEDTMTLTSSALPAGWTLVVNPPAATLGPLETLDLEAKLSAPPTAKPGDIASVVLFAMSATDPLQVSSVVLRAQVGFHAFTLTAIGDVPSGAPQETVSRVLNLTNTGTLPDQVQLRGRIDTTGMASHITLGGGPTLVDIDPGQTVQLTATAALGNAIPSDSTFQWSVLGNSLLDARPAGQRANATLALTAHVLPYQSGDVNDDDLLEFAVDRNDDDSDGFEEFKPTTTPGGRPLASADLARFLRDDARAGLERDVTLADGTTQRVLVYTVDGDEDGKIDHFLDSDGDGQPDYYWDPDSVKASPITFRKDINGDQVPESFVDTDGDGEQDAVFDLTRGVFTDVIQIDVDGDGRLDYVVDKDGDGKVDQDETVLFTRTGSLLIVQKVDVDGDGRLDQVFDTDGDGNPDYFIPDGSTDSVAISLRDVNGDGVQDWTFDGDGDGRKESYYDPATGTAHVIDAAGHFVDALKKYWYVGALFALVVVLFVALVLVTRR